MTPSSRDSTSESESRVPSARSASSPDPVSRLDRSHPSPVAVMRTAVVHDWLNGMRGGEKVLEEMLPLLPDPTVFTLFHVPGSVSGEIERYPIRVSFLNRLPFARRHYRHYLPLFARAVESLDLSGFDLVVSSSHCVAKGAVAAPGVPHLCYCHTPVRYAYEQFDAYFPSGRTRWGRSSHSPSAACAAGTRRRREGRRGISPTLPPWRSGSAAATAREAAVCHPPVDVEFFSPGKRTAAKTSCSPSARSFPTSATNRRSPPREASAGPSSSSEAVRRKSASATSPIPP